MKFGDIHIRYHGFHPTDYTKSQVDAVLQEIYDESPDGSALKASISRKGDLLKGIVEVNSAAGPFFATATSRGLHDVLNRPLEQMRRRLGKWKSKRYQNESIKNLSVHSNESKEEGYDSSVA
jgi:hypothetical protein